jgi:hypothetical protein
MSNADPEIEDVDGQNPFHLAVLWGETEIQNILRFAECKVCYFLEFLKFLWNIFVCIARSVSNKNV